MSDKIKHSAYLGIVIFLAFFRFYDLGSMEVQPWDEAMYGVRIISVLEFDEWLDQTEYSCGGLYSSVHPPLYIWLTASVESLLEVKHNAFFLRLVSALCGAGLILLLYFFFEDKLTGLFSAFTLSMVPFFHFYTRMGQLDIIMTFFIMLSVFFFYKNELSNKYIWLILAGIAFGLSLMSKAIVAVFLPIAYAFYLEVMIFYKKEKWNSAITKVLIIMITGLLLALPWHLYMYSIHGNEFINQLFGYHLIDRAIEGVEHNIKELGAFFYVNQLVVMLSLSLVPIFIAIRKFKERKLILLSVMTFLIPFSIFSISQTKLQTYVLPMLPPLALLAGIGFKELWHREKISWIVIILSLTFAFWSFSHEIRLDVKQLFSNGNISNTLIYYFISGTVLALFLIIVRKYLSAKYIVAIMLLFLAVRFTTNQREPYFNSNIEKAGSAYINMMNDTLTYIETVNNSGAINPQLDYYFHGISQEWEKNELKRRKFYYIQTLKDTYDINDVIKKKAMIIVKMKDKNEQIDSLTKFIGKRTNLFSSDDIYNIYVNGY